jgi:hypothetical protein
VFNLIVGFGVFCLLFLVVFGLGHLALLILGSRYDGFEDVCVAVPFSS